MKIIVSSSTMLKALEDIKIMGRTDEFVCLEKRGSKMTVDAKQVPMQSKENFSVWVYTETLQRLRKLLMNIRDQPIVLYWTGGTLYIQNIDV